MLLYSTFYKRSQMIKIKRGDFLNGLQSKRPTRFKVSEHRCSVRNGLRDKPTPGKILPVTILTPGRNVLVPVVPETLYVVFNTIRNPNVYNIKC